MLFAYFYGVSLSIMTTSYSSNSYANFHAKSDLLLVLIFVKSSIDVHQISQKREEKHCRLDTCSSSLFKTPRRLHLDETLQECVFSKFLTLLTNACITQLQMNHILWKCFRFSDNLFVFYFVHYLNWACYRFNELDALRKRSVPTIDDFYLG